MEEKQLVEKLTLNQLLDEILQREVSQKRLTNINVTNFTLQTIFFDKFTTDDNYTSDFIKSNCWMQKVIFMLNKFK